ncbi:MAG: RsmB/NOP family class I SAM-dependent RNA methyltransferase [Micropepsaceae bacterium]
MTPGARLAAAAEVIHEILTRKAAADRVLLHWGKAHRFAGSKDRAAIAERVYTVLRRLNECAIVTGSSDPRALVVGSLRAIDSLTTDAIAALCVDGSHALGELSSGERDALQGRAAELPGHVSLNYPQWLHADLASAFGERLTIELRALNERAPLDLRVNLLKADRESLLEELKALSLPVKACVRSATGIRFEPGSDPKLNSLACYIDGRVEVQDESSQLAVEFAAVKADEIVVDLAAGAGGKTLALAAVMQNRGCILACDVSAERLERMRPRVVRAGASNIRLAGDPYSGDIADRVGAGADIVFVDAPCSGSGTWRRNPEAKWNLTPETLQGYRDIQARLLDRAAVLVNKQGRVVYAVCSVLPAEGPQQAEAFCARHPDWHVSRHLALTPAQSGTDGFYAAELKRAAL